MHDMVIVRLQRTIEWFRNLVVCSARDKHLRVRTLELLEKLRKYRRRIFQAVPTRLIYTAAKNYIIITVFNVGENEGVRAPNFSSGKVTKSW